jgi:hypothetical protein
MTAPNHDQPQIAFIEDKKAISFSFALHSGASPPLI